MYLTLLSSLGKVKDGKVNGGKEKGGQYCDKELSSISHTTHDSSPTSDSLDKPKSFVGGFVAGVLNCEMILFSRIVEILRRAAGVARREGP